MLAYEGGGWFGYWWELRLIAINYFNRWLITIKIINRCTALVTNKLELQVVSMPFKTITHNNNVIKASLMRLNDVTIHCHKFHYLVYKNICCWSMHICCTPSAKLIHTSLPLYVRWIPTVRQFTTRMHVFQNGFTANRNKISHKSAIKLQYITIKQQSSYIMIHLRKFP